MKKLIVAFAAVTALASAAMAHPMHARGGNRDMRGAEAQAMAYGAPVNTNGRELGGDPDPQVRLQLLRSAGIFDR